MKFCVSCGAELELDVELCPRCGDVADERPPWRRYPAPSDAIPSVPPA